MPLLGSAARDTVELAASADLALEVTAAEEGGVRLQQRLAFDDVPTTYDVLGTVGTSGLFAVQSRGKARHLVVGPTPHRLSDDERALTHFPHVTVPDAEMPDFLESVYPPLRRRVRLRCYDGSVALPEPPTPQLALTVTSPAAQHAPPGLGVGVRPGALLLAPDLGAASGPRCRGRGDATGGGDHGWRILCPGGGRSHRRGCDPVRPRPAPDAGGVRRRDRRARASYPPTGRSKSLRWSRSA